MVAIGSALTHLWFLEECATPPHVHAASMCITTRDEFFQAFPRVSLQATNAEVRPAYEATVEAQLTYKFLLFGAGSTLVPSYSVLSAEPQTLSFFIIQSAWKAIPNIAIVDAPDCEAGSSALAAHLNWCTYIRDFMHVYCQ